MSGTAGAPDPASGLVVGPDGLARPAWAATDPLLREYYDTEWGMPVRDERGVFERLSLEAFQSGLSWATILRKRTAFREAFDGFDPDRVAGYGDRDVERLLADAGIVRNRAKVLATITNARATVALREHPDGDLAAFVWSFRPGGRPAAGHARRGAHDLAGVGGPVPGRSSATGSPSSGRRRCSRSWRRSASSTPTCWAATGGAPAASGRVRPQAVRHRVGGDDGPHAREDGGWRATLQRQRP